MTPSRNRTRMAAPPRRGAGFASKWTPPQPTLGVLPVLAAAGKALAPLLSGPIGKAIMGSRRPESDVWDAYKGISGTARGIELDPQFRNEAFVGLFRFKKNTFPPRQKSYGPNDDAKFLDDMAAQIAAAVRAGTVTAADDASSVFAKVVNPWVSQMGDWSKNPPDWERWEKQILTDLIDAYLYDQPIVATSYTTSRHAQPRLSDVAKSMQPTPPPASAPPASPPASSSTPPASSAPPATTVPAPIADNTRAQIEALLQQGASNQQAIAAAMQSLAAQGVPSTPALQQAITEEVQTKREIPWPWIIGGTAAAAALAVTAVALTRRRRR